MNTLVRTLLVWLVLLAVPLQGFATAAMACAHGMAPAANQHGAAAQAHHAPAAQPPCHGQAVQVRPDAQDDGAGADSSHDKKCGNCAACSIGAVIAPASSSAPGDFGPCSCCPVSAPGRIAAADPDLPERPPRTRLA